MEVPVKVENRYIFPVHRNGRTSHTILSLKENTQHLNLFWIYLLIVSEVEEILKYLMLFLAHLAQGSREHF